MHSLPHKHEGSCCIYVLLLTLPLHPPSTSMQYRTPYSCYHLHKQTHPFQHSCCTPSTLSACSSSPTRCCSNRAERPNMFKIDGPIGLVYENIYRTSPHTIHGRHPMYAYIKDCPRRCHSRNLGALRERTQHLIEQQSTLEA